MDFNSLCIDCDKLQCNETEFLKGLWARSFVSQYIAAKNKEILNHLNPGFVH